MKYRKLTRESTELLDRKDKGKKLKSKKIEKILASLEEKKTRYEARLESDLKENDQHDLEVRLSVLNTQIDKLKKLVAPDDDREDAA